MLRKNGKPTSCEPCRISKIRCDHTTPICKRCETRGLESKCYYHPAPLTRPNGKHSRNKITKARAALSHSRVENTRNYADDSRFSSHSQRLGGESCIQYTHLGSTSFLPALRGNLSGLTVCPSLPPSVDLERWRGDRVYIASQLIRLLCSLDLYIELITAYYAFEVFTIVPARLLLDPLRHTKAYLESNGLFDESRQEDLYAKITKNTGAPLPTTATTPEEFYSLYSTENVRWEFIGIIFSLAGVGAVCFPASGSMPRLHNGEQLNVEAFVAEMAVASNACAQLSKRYDNINDLMIWLQASNTGLSADVFGETSHHVYGLFGDLVSDVYAMELHRYRPPESDVPFFLSEIRKRIFASLYRTDKNLATFVGRPPRLPYQYCDAALPLEIDNDDPLLDGPALGSVLKNVDHDGWNITATSDGKIRSSAVVRLRYTISRLREKVLSLSLGRQTENFSRELMETHRDIKQLWAKIPVHFHYNPECWDSRNSITSLITLVVHLEYLHTVFQIDRIRCRENLGEMKDLIDTSLQVLSAVMDFAKYKRVYDHLSQFSWLFLLYAYPCAGAVATELHRCTLAGIPLPSSSTRSTIIRNLSIIVSWLETENHSSNPTHKAGVEVNKAITKLLDDALNHQLAPTEPQPGISLATAHGGVQECGEGNTGEISRQPISCLNPEPADNDPVNDIVFDSSENFLKWLDELGVEATVPELPL